MTTRISRFITPPGLLLALLLALTACTVSEEGITVSPPPPEAALSGTAAAGAPIAGTVTVKDSSAPARSTTVNIEANGHYTVAATGLTPPFLLRADGFAGANAYHLYSAATAADRNGTVNITPFTDLIVTNLAQTNAKNYFDYGNFSAVTPERLNARSNELREKIAPILRQLGVSDTIDLLRTGFTPDHTGLDAALELIRIRTDPNSQISTLENIITREEITSHPSGGYSGILANPAGIEAGISARQEIADAFTELSARFAQSLPRPTEPRLLALFDPANFKNAGQDLPAFLAMLTSDPQMQGLTFDQVVIQAINFEAGTALAGFRLSKNGTTIESESQPWSLGKSDGGWRLQGDRRPLRARIYPQNRIRLALADPAAGLDLDLQGADPARSTGFVIKLGGSRVEAIESGVVIHLEDPGQMGITSAVVSGKGLDRPLTLIKQNDGGFRPPETAGGGEFYPLSAEAIGTMAGSGELYSIELFAGSTRIATWSQALSGRPATPAELSGSNAPLLIQTNAAGLTTINAGTATKTWAIVSDNGGGGRELTIDFGNAMGSSTILEGGDRVAPPGQPPQFRLIDGDIRVSGHWTGFNRLAIQTSGTITNDAQIDCNQATVLAVAPGNNGSTAAGTAGGITLGSGIIHYGDLGFLGGVGVITAPAGSIDLSSGNLFLVATDITIQ